jgi:hypothetical protein
MYNISNPEIRYYYKPTKEIIGDFNYFLVLDSCKKGLERVGEKAIAIVGNERDAQLLSDLLNRNTVNSCRN